MGVPVDPVPPDTFADILLLVGTEEMSEISAKYGVGMN